jgi:competence protein ComEA
MEFNLFGVKIKINKEYLVLAAVILIVIIGFAVYRFFSADSDLIIDASANTNGQAKVGIKASGGSGNADQADGGTEQAETIQVYVVGCVKSPGVVTLGKGQIIRDAIEKAGGATEDADIENINLAYKLNSNVMIRIRSIEDGITATGSTVAGPGAEIIEDSGGALVKTTSDSGKININKASALELQALPGIGEVMANDIIAYRNLYGPFKTIEDIMKVPNIKKNRFENIRELITVE